MGLFQHSGMPTGLEVLRAVDATKPRRRGAVLLAIMAVVSYGVLSLDYKGHFWVVVLVLMPWLLATVFMTVYIPSLLFAADKSAFVYLDAPKRQLVFLTIEGGDKRRRDVAFRDIHAFNIEREQIRSGDNYSDTTSVEFTLVARTASGERLVVAGPQHDSNPAAQENADLSAVRARLGKLVGLTP